MKKAKIWSKTSDKLLIELPEIPDVWPLDRDIVFPSTAVCALAVHMELEKVIGSIPADINQQGVVHEEYKKLFGVDKKGAEEMANIPEETYKDVAERYKDMEKLLESLCVFRRHNGKLSAVSGMVRSAIATATKVLGIARKLTHIKDAVTVDPEIFPFYYFENDPNNSKVEPVTEPEVIVTRTIQVDYPKKSIIAYNEGIGFPKDMGGSGKPVHLFYYMFSTNENITKDINLLLGKKTSEKKVPTYIALLEHWLHFLGFSTGRHHGFGVIKKIEVVRVV